MTWISRIASVFGVARAADATAALAAAVPRRAGDLEEARSLAAVYRAVQVITTAASQLSINVERSGAILTGSQVPAIITTPDPRNPSRSAWLVHLTASLALYGNAYARIERDSSGAVLALRPLDPRKVWVNTHPATHALRFGVEGEVLTASDVLHAHLQPATIGEPFGLGPIQAARADLNGARDVRDFATQWFDGTGQPTGILSSPSATFDEAIAVRNAWNGLDKDGRPIASADNPSRVKVLPKAFTYSPLAVSPKDAQWVEAQEFGILQVARLFGIPATLMLAAPQGGSMTYSNVEQDWIAFVRFTLMAYLRPLEDALTAVLARGQTARFNLDALLRSDTKTRYDAYAVALDKGFMTIDEVRALENRAPLPPAAPQ